MYDEFFNTRCPKCGGTIGYHINSYGKVVRSCSNCKYVIPDDPVITTNKTPLTDFNKYSSTTNNIVPHNYSEKYIKLDDTDTSKLCCKSYEIDQTKLNTIEIKCKTVTLKQGEVGITFDLDMQLKDYDSIIINGVKFKRVEE